MSTEPPTAPTGWMSSSSAQTSGTSTGELLVLADVETVAALLVLLLWLPLLLLLLVRRSVGVAALEAVGPKLVALL